MTDINNAQFASVFLHENLTVTARAIDRQDRDMSWRLAVKNLHAVAKHMGFAVVPLEEMEPEADKQETEREAA